jgi:hypothetical protein
LEVAVDHPFDHHPTVTRLESHVPVGQIRVAFQRHRNAIVKRYVDHDRHPEEKNNTGRTPQ